MKNIYLNILAATFMLSTSSCSDFLTELSPNEITEETFWKTEDDLFAGITAAYSTLTQNYFYGPYEYEWVPLMYRCDEVDAQPQWTNWPEMMTFRLDNSPTEIGSFWSNQYAMIARSNVVIEACDKMLIDQNIKDRYIAEGKFLRAFAYLRLLQNFRYPVYKPSFPKSEDDFQHPQLERSEIFKFIEEDLTFAMKNLPIYDGSNNDGRALAGTAAAFLGKAYLYQQKYKEASDIFKRIVDDKEFGSYGLLNNFEENFNGKNENSKESLFQAQYGSSNINKRTTHSIATSYSTQGEAWPSQWLFDEMSHELDKNGEYDCRLFATIFCNLENSTHPAFEQEYREKFKEEIQKADAAGGSPLFVDKDGKSIYYNKLFGVKYCQSDKDMAEGWRNTTNINYMRYADVLLMLAEALNEQGEFTQALPYINMVRARANMSDLTANSKEDLREKIMHERVMELAFEMDRYADLTRWDAAGFIDMQQVMRSHNKNGIENFKKNKHEYLPIPLAEVTYNKMLDSSKLW